MGKAWKRLKCCSHPRKKIWRGWWDHDPLFFSCSCQWRNVAAVMYDRHDVYWHLCAAQMQVSVRPLGVPGLKKCCWTNATRAQRWKIVNRHTSTSHLFRGLRPNSRFLMSEVIQNEWFQQGSPIIRISLKLVSAQLATSCCNMLVLWKHTFDLDYLKHQIEKMLPQDSHK